MKMTQYEQSRHEMDLEHDRTLTVAQIRHLVDMVKKGKYPDGNYSDDECNVWEMLRELEEKK